jgi:hypothetical protein
MRRFSETNTQSRESGSSAISQKDNTEKNIDTYLKKRENAIAKENVIDFPKVSFSPYISSVYGTGMIYEYKTNISFGDKFKMNRHILFCGDMHTYMEKCKDSTFLLDWIYGMCLKHPTKKFTLLVEHPEKKILPRLFDRKIHKEALLKLRDLALKRQSGPMFGIMWKLRKKINFENFTTIGIDARQIETGGISILRTYYKDTDVVKLGMELTDVLSMYIHLLRFPTKKWNYPPNIKRPQRYLIKSFFEKTKVYFENVSRIVNDALEKSFFKDTKDLFYKLLYRSLAHRLTDIIDSETVIMDAYCLAIIFKIKGDDNIIINGGTYHIRTYVEFLKILKQTYIFHKEIGGGICVSFPDPYDFLE